MDGDEGGGAGVDRSHFFKHQRGVQARNGARPPAAFSGAYRPQSPVRPPWRWPLWGRCLRRPTRRVGGQFGQGKVAGGVGKGALFFGQLKVHGVVLLVLVWVDGAAPGRAVVAQPAHQAHAPLCVAVRHWWYRRGLRAGFSVACVSRLHCTKSARAPGGMFLAVTAGVRGRQGAHHVFAGSGWWCLRRRAAPRTITGSRRCPGCSRRTWAWAGALVIIHCDHGHRRWAPAFYHRLRPLKGGAGQCHRAQPPEGSGTVGVPFPRKAREGPVASGGLMVVVFTPWLLVLSSNQRAVTVLVWV